MSNALHDYAKLFERYAANNGGTGAILARTDCLSLASEMRMDADAIEAENAKLRELVRHLYTCMSNIDIDGNYECFLCEYENTNGLCDYERLMRELGVEVDIATFIAEEKKRDNRKRLTSLRLS